MSVLRLPEYLLIPLTQAVEQKLKDERAAAKGVQSPTKTTESAKKSAKKAKKKRNHEEVDQEDSHKKKKKKRSAD